MSAPEEQPESLPAERKTWIDRHWNACKSVGLAVFALAVFGVASGHATLLAIAAEFLLAAAILIFVLLFVIGLVLPKSWLEKITPSAKRGTRPGSSPDAP